MIELDAKELKERVSATNALFKENPQHFVEYGKECKRESEDESQDIRRVWDDTWKAYQNEHSLADKEEWQSALSIPKPFSTIQQAKAIIRKALTTSSDFFDLVPVDKDDAILGNYISKTNSVIRAFQGEKQGNFPIAFTDATEMAFVTGQSMEMIPTWSGGQFKWELVEPWKIYRDPNALPRDPQSGNYWIHEEWVDEWILRQLAKRGILVNIDNLNSGGDDIDKDLEKSRRNQIYQRHKFNKTYRVFDFCGIILDSKGDLLLPRGRYSVCQNRVIRKPQIVPYQTLRWPGVSFSPIPHILRFEGRGLIEGVVDLWKLINNLINLHVDNLNWTVNPIRELTMEALVDPDDLELHPGKLILRKPGFNEPALLQADIRSSTPEVLANAQYLEKIWQNSTFVSEFLEGLPGSRSEITKGEVEIKTEAGLGVFNSMARDLEQGATSALWAAYEIMAFNLTYDNPTFQMALMNEPDEVKAMLFRNKDTLAKNASISVSGISSYMKRMDMLKKLEAGMIRAESPMYAPYIKRYNLISAYFDILDLDRYDSLHTPQAAQKIDAAIQQQAMLIAAMQGQSPATGSSSSEPSKGGQQTPLS